MSVVLDPLAERLRVDDTITVAEPVAQFEFVLNAGFDLATDSGRLETLATSADGLRKAYRVTLQTAATSLKLHYHGQPRFSGQRSMGEMPQGIVSQRGVYLDGASAWYPRFDGPVGGLAMEVTLPEGWRAISIGRYAEIDGRTRWTTDLPHDDIHLIAGPYTRHARRHGDTDLSVWLLDDDRALAERYLAAGGDYLDHYSRLIGAYPYAKFAVIENRWQTGYGMASFTLLGSRVIRLPFIPYTSLPHEILHNWWGNGVWIDYAKGNWSEGLTAYLADHWMEERRGKGDQYRLKALQRYSNFAADGQDMPLLAFVSRHNDATQSIGYSKSLMLFHMLRQALGDEAFVDGLRRVWQQHRFRAIGFEQMIDTLSGEHREAARLARQWLTREGAPRLRLDDVSVAREDSGGYLLRFSIGQDNRPFEFDLPVAVTLDDGEPAQRHVVRISRRRQAVELALPSRPLRLDIDPAYDVLRYLDPSEQPPALNRLFGGPSWIVLPHDAPRGERTAWRALAAQWRQRYPQLQIIDDSEAQGLDARADRLILGWQNRLRDEASRRLQRSDQALHGDGVVVAGETYPADSFATVLVNNDRDGVTTGFIGAPSVALIEALARKLPHYGSYGRLLFDAQADNLRKDALGSSHSSLSRQLGERPVGLQLPPRAVLGGEHAGR